MKKKKNVILAILKKKNIQLFTQDYKKTMDKMLEKQKKGQLECVSWVKIKNNLG